MFKDLPLSYLKWPLLLLALLCISPSVKAQQTWGYNYTVYWQSINFSGADVCEDCFGSDPEPFGYVRVWSDDPTDTDDERGGKYHSCGSKTRNEYVVQNQATTSDRFYLRVRGYEEDSGEATCGGNDGVCGNNGINFTGIFASTVAPETWQNNQEVSRTCSSATYKVRFNWIWSYTGSAPTGEISLSEAEICAGGDPGTISNIGQTLPYQKYQWQKNDGGAWADVSGATSKAYNPTALTKTTRYRRKNMLPGSSSVSYTPEVTITVKETPQVALNRNPTNTYIAEGTEVAPTGGVTSGGGDNCENQYRFSVDGGTSWSAWSSTPPRAEAQISGTAEQVVYQVQSRRVCEGVGCNANTLNTEQWVVQRKPNKATNIAAAISANTAVVTWTDASAIETGYKVIRRNSDGIVQFESEVLEANTTTFTDTELKNCTEYEYEVVAIGRVDNSTSSRSNEVKLNEDISDAFTTTKKLNSSKGYYTDRIELRWTSDKENLINGYRIKRRTYGSSTDWNSIETLVYNNVNSQNYTDRTADAGVLYEYQIIAEGPCGTGTTLYSNTTTDVGFRSPTGTVVGQITYEGGTAVEGVRVMVENTGTSKARSIAFNGTTTVGTVADNAMLNPTNELSLQAWVRPVNTSGTGVILSKFTNTAGYELYRENAKLGVKLGLSSGAVTLLSASEVFADNQFTHVMATYNGANLKLFANGVEVASMAAAGTIVSNSADVHVGRGATTNNYFSGRLDELLIWSKAIEVADIELDYNRYLNGTESSLLLYISADEGVGPFGFDRSRTGSVWNENHMTLQNATWSADVPTSNQLALAGYTDENGSYIINGIAYTDVGSTYTVTPSYPQHSFDPATKVVFIGDGASVQNGVNFIDKSSFTVTGTVFYENTTVPVKDVIINVDGVPVVKSGEVVLTDANGDFEVNVPIGDHFVSLTKNGHTFKNGRYPETGTRDFQEAVSGLQFIDSTTVLVRGRVVGGTREGDKLLGFGKSVNNIGQARVIFQSPNSKDLDVADTSTDHIVVVTTDSSGEYTAEVPPLQLLAVVEMVQSENFINWPTRSLSYSAIPPVQYFYDTTRTAAGVVARVDSAAYQYINKYVHRVEPIVKVTEGYNNEAPFMGESELEYENQVNPSQSATLSLSSSPFNFPVFEQEEEYDMLIGLREVYARYNGTAYVYDSVPVTDAKLLIENQLFAFGSTEEITLTTGDTLYSFIAGAPNLTAGGSYGYLKSLSIQAEVVTPENNIVVKWLPNSGATETDQLFRGYVLGAKAADGTGFVTKGPTNIKHILRDPPGSNSFTAIEKGTSVSESISMEVGGSAGFDLQKRIELGTKFSVGLGVSTETKISNTLNLNAGMTFGGSGGTEMVATTTYNEEIATDSDPSSVGSDADVFVGESYNVLFGATNNLTIFPESLRSNSGIEAITPVNGTGYFLGIRKGFFVIPDGTPTVFMYTQGYIKNTLLPNIENLRNDFFSRNNGIYTSNLSAEDPNFGLSNDNAAFGSSVSSDNALKVDLADTTGLSYTFDRQRQLNLYGNGTDSVWLYNDQIRLWRAALIQNELAKANANLPAGASSVSFSGAVDYTKSVTVESFKEVSSTFNFNFDAAAALEIGANVGGSGISVEHSLFVNINRTNSSSRSSESSFTVAYTLSDGQGNDSYLVEVIPDDNAFTVNVDEVAGQSTEQRSNSIADDLKARFGDDYNDNSDEFSDLIFNGFFDRANASRNGPIFKVKAGQTACPHQAAEYTTLAPAKLKIHEATLQREKPKLRVSQSVLRNVPADQTANFEIVLANESETDEASVSNSPLPEMKYRLQVLESSNPNGATLKVDGINPNRLYDIPGNGSITKVITLERGDIYTDYEDIKVVLLSDCEPSISDTISISAYFLPACTPVNISVPEVNWVVNADNENVQEVLIDGYDYNYTTLNSLSLQYKPEASANWIELQKYYKNVATAPDAAVALPIPTDRPNIVYTWDVEQLGDGAYDLRAVTDCGNTTNTSVTMSGLIDRILPTPFGTPQPADGILSAGEDIMIQFNEPIDEGKLTSQNFDVRGVLNGAPVYHYASVAFDGQGQNKVEIPQGLLFGSGDLTISFWANHASDRPEVLFAQGNSATEAIEVGFAENSRLYFTIAGNTFTATEGAEADKWHHYTVSYSASVNTLSIYKDAESVLSNQNVPEIDFAGTDAAIVLGQNIFNRSDRSHFTGLMHGLRLWNRAQTQPQLAATYTQTLTGREPGLIGSWRMDEAHGATAADNARARKATVTATWRVSPSGKAMNFDGQLNFLTVDGGSPAIHPESDFSVSFWFKGQPVDQANRTFLSTGRGDGTGSNTREGWRIGTDASGNFEIVNNEKVFKASNQSFFDGQWHHVALTVNRSASASLYVDAQLQNTTQSNGFDGFGGPRLWLGVRGYKTGATENRDQYFKGQMDEVRIWNNMRRQEQIDRDRFNRLQGDELGLIGYWPFEDYVTNQFGQVELQESLLDQSAEEFDLSNMGTSRFTDEVPNIKLPRPVEKVNFNYVVNNDKIIITPTDTEARLENTILDITVKDIRDMRNNRMEGTATWSAFIDRNQVVWGESELRFSKQLDEALSFEATVVNQGGQVKEFSISNLPAWLTATPSSGTIQPQSQQVIRFDVSAAVNLGKYSEGIHLSTDFGYDEVLPLSLLVEQALPADWAFNPNAFEMSMSVVGQVIVDGLISTDAADKVGAFVNGECRGISSVRYQPELDRYLVTLTVFSNSPSGEEVEYRIWDASQGVVLSKASVSETAMYSFNANSFFGQPQQPVSVSSTEYVIREFEVPQGWKWMSFGLTAPGNNSVNTALASLNAINGDQLKKEAEFATYDASLSTWEGSLKDVDPTGMYMLKLQQAQRLQLSGVVAKAENYPIPVQQGWNWIGFPSQRNIPIQSALMNYPAKEGDIIKSQYSFSVFSAGVWIGELDYLSPNEGYLLYSSASQSFSFHFPDDSNFADQRISFTEKELPWPVDPHQHQHNMSMVAEVAGLEELALDTDDLYLAAFVGNEARGGAQFMPGGFFGTFYGSVSEELTYKLWYKGNWFNLNETSTFGANQVTGTVSTPFVFSLPQGIQAAAPSGFTHVTAWPNPFRTSIKIAVPVTTAEDVEVRVFSTTGAQVAVLTQQVSQSSVNSGSIELEWAPVAEALPNGVYIIHVRQGQTTEQLRVVKQ
jgi:hypothetical protein